MFSYNDANTLDSRCQEKKTSTWKRYNDQSHWGENGIGTSIRRDIVNRQFNTISNDCFTIMVYRFLKKQMSQYIVNNYSNSEGDVNVHYTDFEKPQPKLLLYLYQQIQYMNGLHQNPTLYYLYTQIPQLFYPYRGGFVVKVGVNNQCSKKKKTGSKHKSTTNIDLQAVVGIIENFLPNSGYAVPDWKYPADILDFSVSSKIGPQTSGRDWWGDQLRKRLPASFGISQYQIGQWLGVNLLQGLKDHLEKYRDEYENEDNYEVESIYNGITGDKLYDKANASVVMDYWDSVIELGLPSQASPSGSPTSTEAAANAAASGESDTTADAGQSSQPLVDMAALALFVANSKEREGVVNIDLSLCAPGPQIPPPSFKCAPLPNPYAQVPDWTKTKEPLLDESTREYSLQMLSPYETPAQEMVFSSGSLPSQISMDTVQYRFSPEAEGAAPALKAEATDTTQNLALMMVEQLRPGVEKLLKFYGKENSKKTVDEVMLKAMAANYYVPTRPNLKMKILVKLPEEILKKIPDKAISYPEEKQLSKLNDLSPHTVILKGEDIKSFFGKTTEALKKYEEEYEIALFKGALKLPGLNLLQTTKTLEKYKTQLIQFLHKNKFPVDSKGKKSVKLEEVILNFSSNYELLSVKGKKAFCPPEELTKGFEEFKNSGPINNKIVSALVVNLPNVIKDITARNPIKREEFFAKYLISNIMPASLSDISSKILTTLGNPSEGIANVLATIPKADIAIGGTNFDKLLSFPELITEDLGSKVIYTIDDQIKNNLQLKEAQTQLMRQQDLWLRHFNAADQLFKDLPSILDGKVNNLEDLFTQLLDKMGVEGFQSLVGKAIQSVAGSLKPEEFAKSALKSLINNADVKQLEDLFKTLPTRFQTIVKSALAEITDVPLPWEMFGIGSRMETPTSPQAQFQNTRKQIFKTLGAPLTGSVAAYEEVEELIYPPECTGFFRADDSYEYSWEDENTLIWKRDGKTGQANLDNISVGHGVWKCRPSKELIKKPISPLKEENDV